MIDRLRIITVTALLILLTALALVLTLALPVGARGEPGGLTDDQLHAAQVAAGEAPAGLMGEGAYTFLLCTIENRVRSPRFPNTFRGVVDQGFFAKPQALTWEEHQIAALYWNGPEEYECAGADDVFYAISEQDRERLGFAEGDFSFSRELPSGYLLALHFYREWPGVGR